MRSIAFPLVIGLVVMAGVEFFLPAVLTLVARIAGMRTGTNAYLPMASVTSLALFVGLLLASTLWNGTRELLQGFGLRHHLRHALTGAVVAIFILSLVVLVLLSSHSVNFHFNDQFSLSGILKTMLFMLPVAIGEELAFRGYFQRLLQKKLSPGLSLAVASGVFMLLHAFNPFLSGMGLFGIFSGGLILGVNFAFTNNLWFGMAMHWVWNVAQGALLGFSVSGIAMQSILIADASGPQWLTGGRFGIESSLICIALNMVMAILLFKVYSIQGVQKKPAQSFEGIKKPPLREARKV